MVSIHVLLVGQQEDLGKSQECTLQNLLISKGVHMLRAVWVLACAARHVPRTQQRITAVMP